MDTDATSASTSDVKNEPKDHLAQAMDELTGGGGKNDDDADIDELNKLGMFFSQTVLMMKMSTRHLPLTNQVQEVKQILKNKQPPAAMILLQPQQMQIKMNQKKI